MVFVQQSASMNPSPSLSTTLSSLNNLVALSNQILPISPSPRTLNANLIECPFNRHHLIPPESLFLHHLRCPSSPCPLPDPKQLFNSLTYPKTLNDSPSDQFSFYLDLATSNFFYRDCPGVVTFSHADAINRTFTLPSVLTLECADAHINNSNSESVCTSAPSPSPILPSEFCSITRELEYWNDYPTSYSNSVRRAISGLGIAKERDLASWIIVNSPRYGVVIDSAMQQHMFLLCCLCFKSIVREASISEGKQELRLGCPVLNQALMWLASRVSILYGATNGKFFVLNFVKKCILVGASVLLLFPLEQESKNPDNDSGGIKDAKPGAQHEDKTNSIQNRKIFVSQVAAAVAALHERSLLEHKIKGFWFPQQPNNYQLVAEHCYLSEKANEERKKRLDYRPLIDYDGLHRHESSNQDTSREKTREELLAEERDYKRRRMSYRGKKINQSTLQVMRDMIEDFMEEIKQAAGVENPVKASEESVMFPSKPPSGHDIPVEANSSGKVSHDLPAVTISNSSHWEQQSCTNYPGNNKSVENAFSRDYEQRRLGHYRSHYYGEDKRNADRGKYHRGRASTSPEGHVSHSRSHGHSIHHKKQDSSNRKKYDDSSRTTDRWQKDTHRNHISDSFLNNAFSDRYAPAESLDICGDDVSSDAKCIKPDKYYDKKLH